MVTQVISVIAGLSIALVGHGISVLNLTPPDFKASRVWFWVAALWMMLWSAAAYLTTSMSAAGASFLAGIEVASLSFLILGLRWIDSRERLRALSGAPVTKGAGDAVRVTPRLVASGTDSVMMDPTDVSMSPGNPEDALLAAIAAFEYDPELPSGPRVLVRAELWFEQQGHKYQGGGRAEHVASGYWRDSPKNQALFGPGVRHELVVAVDHRGLVSAIQDERGERAELHHSKTTFLASYPTAQSHSVRINLIQLEETSRERLAVSTFHYVLHVGENELYLVQIDERAKRSLTPASRPPLAEAKPTPGSAHPPADELGLSVGEIEILQMFAEFRDRHTSEDVAKRMEISRLKAEYHLDRLTDLNLIGDSGERRNAKAVYYLRREGRDLLVALGHIK